MLPLPILNVRLNACHEDWQQMTPVAQGHHCAQCNRTVLDFTASSQADVDAAFQASADGLVCGRFRAGQLAPTPQLRPKLRRFLVALVLVCGVGLSRREAVAQLVQCTKTPSGLVSISEMSAAALGLSPSVKAEPAQEQEFLLGMVAEQMPEFKGGRTALMAFLRENLRYPEGATSEGRLFVSFTVAANGQVQDASILKGLGPLLDKEALRVIGLMPAWEPGSQQGKAVDVRYTLPVTFQSIDAQPETHKRKPR